MRGVLFLCLLFFVSGQSRSRVDSLPGFGRPPTNHYSGFVPVNETTGSVLFYYFVESERSPSTDPVIWWMNGGPGASSMIGLLGEVGPLLLAADGNSLFRNPYGWNRHANLLFVEFAPGVGYSFCKGSYDPSSPCKQEDGSCSPCEADDDSVAKQNVAFISTFLQHPLLFPELQGRPFYLAGESYAGVYLPTLALSLLQRFSDTKILNLNGFWLTDPCTDNKAQYGWLDLGIDFAHNMGQITPSVYQKLASSDCTSSLTQTGDRTRINDTQECRHAWRLYDIATAGIGEASQPAEIPGLPMYIDPLNVFGLTGGPDIEGYLNRNDVRNAINTTMSMTPNKVYHLAIGNNGYPQYHQTWAACNGDAPQGLPSMIDVYKQIIALKTKPAAANFKVMIISSGVQDPVVAMPGTEAAVNAIGLPVLSGGDRRPWFFNATGTDIQTLIVKPFAWGPNLHAADADVQLGGFITDFNAGAGLRLMFTTVHGSGHMVPAYAPQSAFHVIHRALLQNAVISPLLPSNWDSVSDADFYARTQQRAKGKRAPTPGMFAQWVVQAMNSSYVN